MIVSIVSRNAFSDMIVGLEFEYPTLLPLFRLFTTPLYNKTGGGGGHYRTKY